jgi:hypothetical protein
LWHETDMTGLVGDVRRGGRTEVGGWSVVGPLGDISDQICCDKLHASFRIRYSRRPPERLGVFWDTSVPPTDGRDELDR